jgi:gliding motility-associated-like protein
MNLPKIYYLPLILLLKIQLVNAQTPCISSSGISGSSTVCYGMNSGTIELTGYSGSVLNWEYTTASTPSAVWSTVSGNQTYSISYNNLTETTYYRAYIQNSGCSAGYSPVATITVSPLSVGGLITADTASVCYGMNKSTLTLTGQTGNVLKWEYSENNGVDWNDIISTKTSQTATNLTQSTIYRALVKSGTCDIIYSALKKIKVNPLPIANFDSPTACFGKYNLLTSTSKVTSGEIVGFQWNLDDGSHSTLNQVLKKYKNSGTYNVQLEVVTDKGCRDTITKEVQVSELPVAKFNFTNACIGTENSFLAKATIENGQALNYLWNFGDGSESSLGAPNHLYNSSGSYLVTLYVFSATDNCIDSLKQTVEVFSLPQANAGNDTSVIYNTPYTLAANGGVKYYWQPSELVSDPAIANPQIVLKSPTSFVVTVTDANGCTASDSVNISVHLNEKIYPSNILTPDGNGENDVWIVKNIEAYPNCEVHIFDCRGLEVYYTVNYQNNWDGRNKSNDILPDGSYYYVIRFQTSGTVYKGVITLLRKK